MSDLLHNALAKSNIQCVSQLGEYTTVVLNTKRRQKSMMLHLTNMALQFINVEY